MPHKGVTVYDLLLSCPGDVVDLKPTIEDCVKSFNSSIGEINNIRIELKHWSTDSFPQSGDKPQNILNKQFVDDCDLCIALLGVRFGTPTDNFDSGTEEEIENMLAQNKQVFLYFVDRQVNPSTIDFEQYSKVKTFQEKYSNKGIYSVVKNAEDLRKEFQNALTMYFIRLVAPTTTEIAPTFMPNLTISTQDEENDIVKLTHNKFTNAKITHDKEKVICEKIKEICDMKIEFSIEESLDQHDISNNQVEKMTVGELLKARQEGRITNAQYSVAFGRVPPTIERVTFSENETKIISDFCNLKQIVLPEDFFCIGNLQKEITEPLIKLYTEHSITFKGSESEKKKYKLIRELIKKIREYNDVMEYFEKIDKFYCASFVISNIGTTFDEDIDVRVCVDKEHLIDISDIPQPGELFLKEVVDVEAPRFLFSGGGKSDIQVYTNYPSPVPYIPDSIMFPFGSNSDEIEKQQKEYNDLIENIFCYDVYQNEKEDILCFNIPYLKQNTKMFFPSYLLFKTVPEYIRYEIRSKHSPNVYSKKFSIIGED